MSMFLYKLFLSMMILPFWGVLIGGVTFSDDPFYRVAVLIGFGLSVVLHEPILQFLTLDKVFLTRVLSISLLSGAFLFFADYTIPGFSVDTLNSIPIQVEGFQLQSYELGKYYVIALLAVLTGITYYTLVKLRSKA